MPTGTSPWPWLFVAMGGMGLGLVGLALPAFFLQASLLTVFLGVITAVPVGFTLKGPQLFSLLGLLAYSLQPLWHRQKLGMLLHQRPPFPLYWILPFLGLALSFLPSLYGVAIPELSLGADQSPIRLLFNLGLLYVFTLFLLLSLRTSRHIKQAIYGGLFSGTLSLLFGYGQQIAFYLGRYNPFAHIGRHNSIVDFYGPFLRFAPGTFANEYGEILQSLGLFAFMLLYLPGFTLSRKVRTGLKCFLAALIVALVLNFTRASWLVFAATMLCQMVYARFSVWRLLGIGLAGGLVLGGLLYVSQQVLEVSLLLQIGARFEELGSPQAHSAGQRLATWALAWDAFLEAPWLGQGLGKYVETHNVPLQLLAETGVVGFMGFYGCMLWFFGCCARAYQRTQEPWLRSLLWTSVLAVGGCLAFDLTNHGIYHFVLWYCISLGLAGAAYSHRKGKDDTADDGSNNPTKPPAPALRLPPQGS